MMKVKRAFAYLFDCEFKAVAVLSLFILVGLCYGAYYIAGVHESTELCAALSLGTVADISVKYIFLLFVVFLLGYAVIGVPIVCFILLYYGMSTGIFLGAYGCLYGLKGCAVAAVCFYFFYLSLTLCVLNISYSSVRLSFALYSVFKNNTRFVSPRIYSKPHIIRFFALAVLVFIACVYYVFIGRRLALILL